MAQSYEKLRNEHVVQPRSLRSLNAVRQSCVELVSFTFLNFYFRQVRRAAKGTKQPNLKRSTSRTFFRAAEN